MRMEAVFPFSMTFLDGNNRIHNKNGKCIVK